VPTTENAEQLLPIDSLLFKEPVTAGADIFVIAALTKFYRDCNEHTTPVVVQLLAQAGDEKLWRIMDGRHRVIASILAGRKTVLAVEEIEHA